MRLAIGSARAIGSEPIGAHEPGDPLARAAGSAMAELGVDPRHAARAQAVGVDRPDPLRQRGVGHRPRRGRPTGGGHTGRRCGVTRKLSQPSTTLRRDERLQRDPP